MGSRVVHHEGKNRFHLDAAEINVRLVRVEPRTVLAGSATEWEQVCDAMAPQPKSHCGLGAASLFDACLLASQNPRAGSVLIAGFQHVVGDASSYSTFLRTWSEKYEELLKGSARQPVLSLELPKGTFRIPKLPSQPSAGRKFLSGSFRFSDSRLRSLKTCISPNSSGNNNSQGQQCTTNDVLMAQFACAIAPFRLSAMRAAAGLSSDAGGFSQAPNDPIHTPPHIVVLADRRGRGMDVTSFGNHNTDLCIRLSWPLLLSGDIAAVAGGQLPCS